MKKIFYIITLFASINLSASAIDCYKVEGWATQIAIETLIKNKMLSRAEVNAADVVLETNLLFHQEVGIDMKELHLNPNSYLYGKIYRQIQDIEIKTSRGNFLFITISDVTDEECSMNSPIVILIYPELKVLRFDNTYLENLLISKNMSFKEWIKMKNDIHQKLSSDTKKEQDNK